MHLREEKMGTIQRKQGRSPLHWVQWDLSAYQQADIPLTAVGIHGYLWVMPSRFTYAWLHIAQSMFNHGLRLDCQRQDIRIKKWSFLTDAANIAFPATLELAQAIIYSYDINITCLPVLRFLNGGGNYFIPFFTIPWKIMASINKASESLYLWRMDA